VGRRRHRRAPLPSRDNEAEDQDEGAESCVIMRVHCDRKSIMMIRQTTTIKTATV